MSGQGKLNSCQNCPEDNANPWDEEGELCGIHKAIRVWLTHLHVNTVWVLTSRKSSSALYRCLPLVPPGREGCCSWGACAQRCRGFRTSPQSHTARLPDRRCPSLPCCRGCSFPRVGKNISRGGDGTRHIPGNVWQCHCSETPGWSKGFVQRG